ncbi:MAG: 4-hydroxy-tetrahydrodipicolinate synthase [Bacilli bacterium]|nr:4-hydroxy-tetrahydrodipicolinate synthase [Bacilli bacterium]
MKDVIFTGVATALITPFKNGEIDYPAFARIIEEQIAAGVDALVVAGTTGECSTLTDEEQFDLIEFAVKTVNKRIPVIAGTGSNDTRHGIKLCQGACERGADALLIVTPYYNKTSQRGLVAHYYALADASSKPIIVYNVPSRTGMTIAPETYVELAKHPMINSVKEASGNIEKIKIEIEAANGELNFYSGNDDQILDIMELGGLGVISVLSNVMPKETKELTETLLRKDYSTAKVYQTKYMPLIKALFSDVNPIPVKEAMAMLGYCDIEMRMPLIPLEEEKRVALKQELKNAGFDL